MAQRKVIYGGACSLDGFFAGKDGAIDWLHFSKDVEAIMQKVLVDDRHHPDGPENVGLRRRPRAAAARCQASRSTRPTCSRAR